MRAQVSCRNHALVAAAAHNHRVRAEKVGGNRP